LAETIALLEIGDKKRRNCKISSAHVSILFCSVFLDEKKGGKALLNIQLNFHNHPHTCAGEKFNAKNV
jgi:hypothetical protein